MLGGLRQAGLDPQDKLQTAVVHAETAKENRWAGWDYNFPLKLSCTIQFLR